MGVGILWLCARACIRHGHCTCFTVCNCVFHERMYMVYLWIYILFTIRRSVIYKYYSLVGYAQDHLLFMIMKSIIAIPGDMSYCSYEKEIR